MYGRVSPVSGGLAPPRLKALTVAGAGALTERAPRMLPLGALIVSTYDTRRLRPTRVIDVANGQKV